MNPHNWIKQPSESRILEIDCTNTLPTGVTITAVTATMYDLANTDVSDAMIEGVPTINGDSVYVQIKGGVSGQFYDCKVYLTLSNDELAEDDLTVQVKNTTVVRR